MKPKRIVIAAGHYPDRPGACYNDLVEHDEAVKVVGHLKRQLETAGFEALVVSGHLNKKIAEVARLSPDATVEIHFNAATDPHAHGTETLYGSNPEDKILAQHIQQKLVDILRLRDRGVKDTAERFAWIRENKCPSVIVEPLFLSNADEAAMLKLISVEIPEIIALAVELGIEDFFKDEGGRMKDENLQNPRLKLPPKPPKPEPPSEITVKEGILGPKEQIKHNHSQQIKQIGRKEIE